MTKIQIRLQDTRLKTSVMEPLIKAFPNMRDLRRRLQKLPLIPKGHYVGNNLSTDYHRSALENQKEGDHLYVGYVISNIRRWQVLPRIFIVDKDGRVREHQKDFNWKKDDYHYVGFEIPTEDIENQTYLSKFSRMSYILNNSPIAMYEE